MNKIDAEILIKLPVPPGFEEADEKLKEEVKKIHEDKTLSWNEKHAKIGKLVESQNDRPASLQSIEDMELAELVCFFYRGIFKFTIVRLIKNYKFLKKKFLNIKYLATPRF